MDLFQRIVISPASISVLSLYPSGFMRIVRLNDTGPLEMPKPKPAEKAKNKKSPCWSGYTARGTKTKGGRTVPNCVPTGKKRKWKAPHVVVPERQPNQGRPGYRTLDETESRHADSKAMYVRKTSAAPVRYRDQPHEAVAG